MQGWGPSSERAARITSLGPYNCSGGARGYLRCSASVDAACAAGCRLEKLPLIAVWAVGPATQRAFRSEDQRTLEGPQAARCANTFSPSRKRRSRNTEGKDHAGEWCAEGRFVPSIDVRLRFPLHQIRAALSHLESGEQLGKLLSISKLAVPLPIRATS